MAAAGQTCGGTRRQTSRPCATSDPATDSPIHEPAPGSGSGIARVVRRRRCAGVGALKLTSNSRIVIDSLAKVADQFRADLTIITGTTWLSPSAPTRRLATYPSPGRPTEADPQGYLLPMADHVHLAGGSDTRIFHGTEILLQCAKPTSSSHCRRRTSINQGCHYRVERRRLTGPSRPRTVLT